jgi:hypothetical protein
LSGLHLKQGGEQPAGRGSQDPVKGQAPQAVAAASSPAAAGQRPTFFTMVSPTCAASSGLSASARWMASCRGGGGPQSREGAPQGRAAIAPHAMQRSLTTSPASSRSLSSSSWGCLPTMMGSSSSCCFFTPSMCA